MPRKSRRIAIKASESKNPVKNQGRVRKLPSKSSRGRDFCSVNKGRPSKTFGLGKRAKEAGRRVTTKKTKTVAAPKRHRQSPIDIRSDAVCYDPKTCQAQSLCISYVAGDCCAVKTSAAGFRVEVGMNCTTRLSASHLPGEFQLTQFHAHWSGDGSCGSEHLLNGKAMSGEVHMVFWNKKYADFSEAAEKDDGLAVLGIFLKEGRSSKEYQPLFDVVRKATISARPVPMPKDFRLEQLIPDRHDFVTYFGSLTTPPFSESVIWTVLIEPVEVSKEQLDVLRAIVPSNFRECQDLCERRILTSTAVTAR